MSLLSLNEVADALQVTPARVRQMRKRRALAVDDLDFPLDYIDHMQLLPAPAAEIGNARAWDPVDIARCAAYRTGGIMAFEVERLLVDAVDAGHSELADQLVNALVPFSLSWPAGLAASVAEQVRRDRLDGMRAILESCDRRA